MHWEECWTLATKGEDEKREHVGFIHKGGRDDWTQVKHIREEETITVVGKTQEQDADLKRDAS